MLLLVQLQPFNRIVKRYASTIIVRSLAKFRAQLANKHKISRVPQLLQQVGRKRLEEPRLVIEMLLCQRWNSIGIELTISRVVIPPHIRGTATLLQVIWVLQTIQRVIALTVKPIPSRYEPKLFPARREHLRGGKKVIILGMALKGSYHHFCILPIKNHPLMTLGSKQIRIGELEPLSGGSQKS